MITLAWTIAGIAVAIYWSAPMWATTKRWGDLPQPKHEWVDYRGRR
jgi:hypothetical protein